MSINLPAGRTFYWITTYEAVYVVCLYTISCSIRIICKPVHLLGCSLHCVDSYKSDNKVTRAKCRISLNLSINTVNVMRCLLESFRTGANLVLSASTDSPGARPLILAEAYFTVCITYFCCFLTFVYYTRITTVEIRSLHSV